MTEGELANHNEKIRKVIDDHLTALGYPAMETDAIMRELKPMWIKLEEARLLLPGMTFEAFCAHADHAQMFEQVRDLMGL